MRNDNQVNGLAYIGPTLASHLAVHTTAEALRVALETVEKMATSSRLPAVIHTALQLSAMIDSLFESEHSVRDEPAPMTVKSL